MAFIELDSSLGYDANFQRFLDSYDPNLLERPELILQLEGTKARKLLSGLLEFACQCTNFRNIELGRAGIWALPKQWVIENLETAAQFILEANDEWEHRRLMEVYLGVDESLVKIFAKRCLERPLPAIQEIGVDFFSPN